MLFSKTKIYVLFDEIIWRSIEFSKVCIDILHVWLRITDKLEKLLVDKIKLIDYRTAKNNEDLE